MLFENADCVNCPEGQFTNGETGKAYCSVCKAGRYRDRRVDQCEDCPIGWYQESAGQFSCLACVAGFHQNEPQKQFCLPCVRKTTIFILLLLFIISSSTLTFFAFFFLNQRANINLSTGQSRVNYVQQIRSVKNRNPAVVRFVY